MTGLTLGNIDLDNLISDAVTWIANALPNVIAAALILVAGYLVARRAGRAVAHMITRTNEVDDTTSGVVRSVVAYGVGVLAIVAALGQLGFQTTSLLAALGAAGLAIGLALQKTLSNIAAGFMLLWLHPFRLNEYIDSPSGSGKVREVGLFATELETWDGVYRFIPNSELWNARITNYSRLPKRLVEIEFGISYDDDIGTARETLLGLASADDRVVVEPAEPFVFVSELGDNAVIIALRAWCATSDYWQVKRELTERGKLELENAGLSFPFPQLRLHAPELAEQRQCSQRDRNNPKDAEK